MQLRLFSFRVFFLTLLLIGSAAMVNAADRYIPKTVAVPGGVVVAPLYLDSQTPPHVSFNGRQAMVFRTENGWSALVGIPLRTKPGRVFIKRDELPPIYINVADKAYETQKIKLPTQKYVEPSPASLERYQRERELSQTALSTWSDEFEPLLEPLQWPIDGRVSGSFGLRRVYNGQARQPHSGIDLAAPTGTPIKAPAPGRVVLTGDFFFNGNTIFVDHGLGLITMYCHLDSFNVTEGQVVATGDVLGTVGATGRVTGPHLHWSVSLNGAMVDPVLLSVDRN